jgi:hypothetical protein
VVLNDAFVSVDNRRDIALLPVRLVRTSDDDDGVSDLARGVVMVVPPGTKKRLLVCALG